MVVATALPNATNVKIVPWIRSSHRRNTAIPEVDCEVVKMLAFMITIAIFVAPELTTLGQDVRRHFVVMWGIRRGVGEAQHPQPEYATPTVRY